VYGLIIEMESIFNNIEYIYQPPLDARGNYLAHLHRSAHHMQSPVLLKIVLNVLFFTNLFCFDSMVKFT